jgi:RNA polymerase sigma-70 factor (ECF subfamily)
MQDNRSISLNEATDVELYDRYGQAIFAYIRLHCTSREDAEDVTVEVFTAALEHNNLAAVREDERLAWLRRVAHNKLVDSYRHTTRHPLVALDRLDETVSSSKQYAPEEIALQREAYQQLHDAVRTLPPTQQHLLQLRYGHGLRFSEIGVLLGKREEAVRKLLSRTLVMLRTIYAQHVQEGE